MDLHAWGECLTSFLLILLCYFAARRPLRRRAARPTTELLVLPVQGGGEELEFTLRRLRRADGGAGACPLLLVDCGLTDPGRKRVALLCRRHSFFLCSSDGLASFLTARLSAPDRA